MNFFVKVNLDLAEKKNINEKSHFLRYLYIVGSFEIKLGTKFSFI